MAIDVKEKVNKDDKAMGWTVSMPGLVGCVCLLNR